MSFLSRFIPAKIDSETQNNIDFFSISDALFLIVNTLSGRTSFYFTSEEITKCYTYLLTQSYETCTSLKSIKSYIDTKIDKVNISTGESNRYFYYLNMAMALLKNDASLLNSQEMINMLKMMNSITIIAKGTVNTIYNLIYQKNILNRYKRNFNEFICLTKNHIISYLGTKDNFFNSWLITVDPFYSTY